MGEVILMVDKDMLEAIGQLLAPIHDDIQSLKADNAEIREDLQALKADNAKLITLEKKVDLILEGQQGINEQFQKLDQVADDVEEIKLKVTALEAVTKDNTSQIKDIRAIK